MSKVQDDEVGDGTTSVTVLAAELLRVRTSLRHRLIEGFQCCDIGVCVCVCVHCFPQYCGVEASALTLGPRLDYQCIYKKIYFYFF